MTAAAIDTGFETVDPRTGTRMRLVEGTAQRGARGFVLEVSCPEGSGPSILPHVHDGWTETFEIVRGTAQYRLDGRLGSAAAGESVEMPAGVPHVHPWNTGDGDMVYRQTAAFHRDDPEAVGDVIGAFATLHGLARAGKVSRRGLPRNPLQFAATLRTLVAHDGYDAAVPIGFQRLVSATLGRLAERLGYRAVDARYIEDAGRR